MSENKNHHYVPQFYFKFFSDDKKRICLLLTKDGRVIESAPIKGQCARNMFYGTVEAEKTLSQIEGQHAHVFRALIDGAIKGNLENWTDEHFTWLIQAISVQKSRTILEVNKVAPAQSAMLLHAFQSYLETILPPDEVAEFATAVKNGQATVTESPTVTVLRQLSISREMSMLLLDMEVRVLRNHTEYPFIFSDSPVVFYNSYYRKITDHGVLGCQTPGLQIFLPLTPTLHLMLFDPHVYFGECERGPFIEITKPSDISHLNALQLHHSHEAVYFSNHRHVDYVSQLYSAHKPLMVKPQSEFRVRTDLLTVEKQSKGEFSQDFEPHLNHGLSLSFMGCDVIDPRDFVFRHRTPELVESHKNIYADDDAR